MSRMHWQSISPCPEYQSGSLGGSKWNRGRLALTTSPIPSIIPPSSSSSSRASWASSAMYFQSVDLDVCERCLPLPLPMCMCVWVWSAKKKQQTRERERDNGRASKKLYKMKKTQAICVISHITYKLIQPITRNPKAVTQFQLNAFSHASAPLPPLPLSACSMCVCVSESETRHRFRGTRAVVFLGNWQRVPCGLGKKRRGERGSEGRG